MEEVVFMVATAPGSNRIGSQGLIFGPIWITLGEQALPAAGWDDSPVVLLRWWMEAARALLAGRPGRFLFMDGPYEIQGHPDPGTGLAALVFYERSAGGRRVRVAEAAVDVRLVCSELVKATAACLDVCRAKGWGTRDVELLALEHERLLTAT